MRLIFCLLERRNFHAENISAQEAPQKEGAWIQKENGNIQWPQGTCSPQSQGKKETYILIFACIRPDQGKCREG